MKSRLKLLLYVIIAITLMGCASSEDETISPTLSTTGDIKNSTQNIETSETHIEPTESCANNSEDVLNILLSTNYQMTLQDICQLFGDEFTFSTVIGHSNYSDYKDQSIYYENQPLAGFSAEVTVSLQCLEDEEIDTDGKVNYICWRHSDSDSNMDMYLTIKEYIISILGTPTKESDEFSEEPFAFWDDIKLEFSKPLINEYNSISLTKNKVWWNDSLSEKKNNSELKSEELTNDKVPEEYSEYFAEVCHLINQFNDYYWEETNHEEIDEQGLTDYLEDESGRIFYPVKEWITFITYPDADMSSVEKTVLRFNPSGRKGLWILDVMIASECLLQTAYPDIDYDDAAAVTAYYEDELYDGDWNWPMQDQEGRYEKDGINCDLYRVINSLFFSVTNETIEEKEETSYMTAFMNGYNYYAENYNTETGSNMPLITLDDIKSGSFKPNSWSAFDVYLSDDNEIERVIYYAPLEEMLESEIHAYEMLYSISAIMHAMDSEITQDQSNSYVNGILSFDDLFEGAVYKQTLHNILYETDIAYSYCIRFVATKK